jgi:hypothetical protein
MSDKSGFVVSHRKIEDWRWYKVPHMAHVFQHLIRKAEFKRRVFGDIVLDRGQLITGRKKLAEETGLTEREIRTVLDRLSGKNLLFTKGQKTTSETASEIAIKTTNRYSVITIRNYDIYQSQVITERPNEWPSERPSVPPTNDQQTTTALTIQQVNNKEISSIQNQGEYWARFFLDHGSSELSGLNFFCSNEKKGWVDKSGVLIENREGAAVRYIEKYSASEKKSTPRHKKLPSPEQQDVVEFFIGTGEFGGVHASGNMAVEFYRMQDKIGWTGVKDWKELALLWIKEKKSSIIPSISDAADAAKRRPHKELLGQNAPNATP